MSGSIADTNRCEPNLVPILDMVFQLITFFMMVVNFKAAAIDRDLMLPVVGSTRPVVEESKSDILVLNIRSNNDVVVRGQVQPNFKEFIAVESRLLKSSKSLVPGEPLPIRVVIRGDRTLPMKSVLGIVDACHANGFDKFDFVITKSARKKKGS